MRNNKYVYEREMEVRDYELDSEGIVNNANYLHYLEHTRHGFCVENGMSFADMQSQGVIPVLNRVEIDQAVAGEDCRDGRRPILAV